MATIEDVEWEEKPFTSKLWSRATRNPFLTFGVLGCLTTLGIGAYNFKNRSKGVPMSLFFIQLRVTAQSVVIGSLTLGLAYNMLNEYVFTEKKEPAKALKN